MHRSMIGTVFLSLAPSCMRHLSCPENLWDRTLQFISWFLQNKIADYDVEKIIDDWVLMGFLVGNDFVPHLPHVHIHQECLPLLWKNYIEIRPKMDGAYDLLWSQNLGPNC